MDSQNTPQKRAPDRKRKPKPSNTEHDNNIKQNIIKKTKKLKKNNPRSSILKKSLLSAGILAVLIATGYFSYKYYENNEAENLYLTKEEHTYSASYVNRSVANQLKSFSPDEMQQLRSVIQNQSLNSQILSIANNPQYSTETVVSYLNDDIHFLNDSNKNEYYTGFAEKTTGITLDSLYNIVNIVPYSSAWRKGLRLNYRLEQVDGKNLVKGLSSNDVTDALTIHDTSKWMFNDSQGRRMTIKSLTKEDPVGDIAESWVYQNTLILRISKINIATPQVINSLISNRLNNNNNIKGVIIDLRNTGSDVYSGLPETAWILNNKQKQVLASIKNKQDTHDLETNAPNIQLDNSAINSFANLPKIVWVNFNTKGSAEVLAYNLKQNGAKLNGDRTSGSDQQKNVYQIGNHFISLLDSKVSIPNNKDFYLNPENNKAIFFIDMLYQDKRKNF